MLKENIKKEILNLIEEIKFLPKEDTGNVIMYLENNELGVALDTLCNQLYENSIKITLDMYQKIEGIGKKMEMSNSEWIFLTELIDTKSF